MGDHLWVGKPCWYVTSHPGQLSLAIPQRVGAVSTSECWEVNMHALAPYLWSSSVSWCLAEPFDLSLVAWKALYFAYIKKMSLELVAAKVSEQELISYCYSSCSS